MKRLCKNLWQCLKKINWLIYILCLIPNVCFFLGICWAIGKPVCPTETNVFSMIIALVALNISTTFFIPLLITKNEIKNIVDQKFDQKFIDENKDKYITQKDIANIYRMNSTLLRKQERYFWALSSSLFSLNKYIRISDKEKIGELINELWEYIGGLAKEITKKISTEDIHCLLKKEFSIDEPSNADEKDLLKRLYIEVFELMCQEEKLSDIIDVEHKELVKHCLNYDFIEIINKTAKAYDIELEEIKSKIKKDSILYNNTETRENAKETLKTFENLIENLKKEEYNDIIIPCTEKNAESVYIVKIRNISEVK